MEPELEMLILKNVEVKGRIKQNWFDIVLKKDK
jgi:hypothetical protein